MPVSDTWTSPATLELATGAVVSKANLDNRLSDLLYLWNSIHGALRQINPQSVLVQNGLVTNPTAVNLTLRSPTGVTVEIDQDNTGANDVFVVRSNGAATDLFSVAENGALSLSNFTAIAQVGSNITMRTPHSIILEIDSDNNASTEVFVVRANGSGTNLLAVNETGDLTMLGAITLSGALTASVTAANNVPTRLAESVLGSAASSIAFTSIPTTYRHLEVVMTARGDTAAQNVLISLRFNNDSANNYDVQSLIADNTTISGGSNVGVSAIDLLHVPAGSATANKFGVCAFTVGAYKATDQHKEIVGYGHAANAGTAAITFRGVSGRWASTVAINRLDLFPAAGNFAAGTTVTLTGIP